MNYLKSLIIIGAGGHGKVCTDIAKAMKKWDEIYFLDDEKAGYVNNVKILGKVNLNKYSHKVFDIFVAIGNNISRKEIIVKVLESNFDLVSLISISSIISDSAQVLSGSVVMPGSVLNSNVKIGMGCIINSLCVIEHDCSIGDFVHISPGCIVCGNVVIDSNIWIGAGTTIINNITISCGVLVGAGSVIVKSINENGTYYGVPARKANYE